ARVPVMMRRRLGPTIILLALFAIALSSVARDIDSRASARPEGPAAELLAQLPVEPENRAGYERDRFGDYDRPAVLAANHADYPDCDGYYSAADAVCHLSADGVQVDHLVPLAEAWDSGAWSWGPDQLDQFAGDIQNLWLMTSALNQAKSDADPAEWLPPAEAAVCDYVTAWIEVKAAYSLSVDQAERAALEQALASCPGGGA